MSEEMTAEQMAMECLEQITSQFDKWVPAFPVLVTAVAKGITAAEDRGRQSARKTIGLVMECRQDALDENERLRAMLNTPPTESADPSQNLDRADYITQTDSLVSRLEAMEKRLALAPSEWADLGELTGQALRERLQSRAMCWGRAARKLEYEEGISTSPDDMKDFSLLINMICAMEQRVTAEVERLEAEDHPIAEGTIVS